MFDNLFSGNWQVIVPLIGAGVALFFPQLKPIIDSIIKPSPGPTPGPSPTPIWPVPPIVSPTPTPDPSPVPNDLSPIINALQLLLVWYSSTRNKEGEAAIREAGRALFAEPSLKKEVPSEE